MNKILTILGLCSTIFILGCGGPDLSAKAVCNHSEGIGADKCNAGDDFSPLTCETAVTQFEAWWRGDARNAVNACMIASACYPDALGTPGPSIGVPLDICMEQVLLSELDPTDAEKDAVASVCTKFGECGGLGSLTAIQCEQLLLSPFGEGQLFLFMGDELAQALKACEQTVCASYSACVSNALTAAGAFNGVKGTSVKVPSMMLQ